MPLDPRSVGSNPAKGNGDKKSIARLPSEGKYLSVPCLKILPHVKEPYRYEKRYFVGKIHGHFL
jgi:hypothetical protein